MKKFAIIIMFLMCLNVFASQDDIYLTEAEGIFSHGNDKRKLRACSEKGNYYCSGMLGIQFHDENNYSSAYPLILKCSQNIKFGTCDLILGLMYDGGKGILQNDDKALLFYNRAAKKGEVDGAYNASVIFFNKALELQYSISQKEIDNFKYHLMKAYAWRKVSQAMGRKEVLLKNGDTKLMSESIDETKGLLLRRGWLSEAEKLSSEICSTIPSCVQ